MPADSGRAMSPEPDPVRVRDAVRERVLDGGYPPDSRIDLLDVAAAHGCSLLDAEAAAHHLAAEGVVRLEGLTVRVVSVGEVELAEIDEVRRGLLEVAMRRFVIRASDSQQVAVASAAAEFRRLATTGATPVALRTAYEWLFGVIFRAASVSNTVDLLRGMRAQIGIVLTAGLVGPGRAQEVADQTDALVASLQRRDDAAAIAVADAHLRGMSRCALRALRVSG